ncbi:MAG TPA: CHAP domain-containing protein [Caulobacteraceae bacterium]|nr:CHAP domain-containing protein [Caulobacteraceae bacterium]
MVGRTRGSLGALFLAAVLAFAPGGALADDYWQCVPFARLVSGIQIFGDAWTWWSQAAGKYQTGYVPKAGAVLCFRPTGRMRLGHVAVVSQVLTDRVIQITHANWSLIDGSRGQVERNVTVVDVSPNGDWSLVKVWNDPSHNLGTTTYPTYGFIYADPATATSARIAAASDAAIAMAQSAASQVVAAVRPGSAPMQMLNQAADSTDRIAALIQQAAGGDAPADKKDGK